MIILPIPGVLILFVLLLGVILIHNFAEFVLSILPLIGLVLAITGIAILCKRCKAAKENGYSVPLIAICGAISETAVTIYSILLLRHVALIASEGGILGVVAAIFSGAFAIVTWWVVMFPGLIATIDVDDVTAVFDAILTPGLVLFMCYLYGFI